MGDVPMANNPSRLLVKDDLDTLRLQVKGFFCAK